MATPRKPTTVIVGGGISGLILAAQFEREGRDYVLVEAQGSLGGHSRNQTVNGATLDYGLKSIPVLGPIAENPLVALKNRLSLGFGIESQNAETLMHGKTEFLPFVGFGELSDQGLAEELGHYTSHPRVSVSGGWGKLIEELVEKTPPQRILLNSEITKIEISEERATALIINGNKRLLVEKVYWTPSPAALPNLLPEKSISPRTISRIKKTTPYTLVSLDLVFDQKVSESSSVFVLKDTVEADFFTVGQFISNIDPLRANDGKQITQWITLVDAEKAALDENVSAILRTMKKNIRKAFPKVEGQTPWERIIVVPESVGSFEHLQLEQDGSVPGLENIYICGAQAPIDGDNRGLSLGISSALKFSMDQVTIEETAEPATSEGSATVVATTESSPIANDTL